MNYGIFAFPFNLFILLSIFILKSKKASKESKILLFSGIAAIVITAFANFCLGGVIFRYTSDISVAAALLSAVVILEICTYIQKNSSAEISRAFKSCVLAVTAITVCISLATCIQINGNIRAYSPEIYEGLKNFFVLRS
jgi:hypothetical protein